MRWKSKEYKGDDREWYRDYCRYLFFPKKINGQWRWLERALWREKRVAKGWVKYEWLNN